MKEVYFATDREIVPVHILNSLKEIFKVENVETISKDKGNLDDFIENIQASCSEKSIFVTDGNPHTVSTLAATISEMNELSEGIASMCNELYYAYDMDHGLDLEKIYPPC